MRSGVGSAVLKVYIPFYLAPVSFLGSKKSVFLHFLKHPNFKSAYGLVNAILEGSKYLDSRRNSLDPWALLGRSLWSLAGIQSHRVVVHIYTNANQQLFNEFILNYPNSNKFEVIYQGVNLQELSHPYMLTWTPRNQMRLDIENGAEQDLYLYLEHDIDFRSENLNYFIRYRKMLRNEITPGFMLVEWNSKERFWSNFQIEKHDFHASHAITLDDLRFIPLKQPYCPVLLLEHALAEEFVKSEFFTLEDFRDMQSQFGLLLRESAAIGMTYFGKEKNYEVRSYVAFHEESKFPTVGAVVRHMPNIYADYDSVPQCKKPLPGMW